MTRRLRFAALAAVAALALSACANNDAKESDVVTAMEDAGLEPDQAECIGQGFQEAFGDDQDLFNELAGAESPEEFPEGTEETVRDIFDECGVEPEDGGGATSDTTEDDTSDTTEASAEGGG
jgi:hypothetical protein